MNAREIILELNKAQIGWCPISGNGRQYPAVMIRHWDAMKEHHPIGIPEPDRGNYYVWWENSPFPLDLNPEDWA